MTVLQSFPPTLTSELAGWDLAWFRLLPTGQGGEALDRVRREAGLRLVAEAADAAPSPVVQEVRRLFRAAGCDPTRYRPSSEALRRRVRKTGGLPAIHPLVDLNNLLSLALEVPCCVVDPAAVEPPFELRLGRTGETMASLRGPFNLADKPVLADLAGPFGTPITDAERVKVTQESHEVWLVAYLVQGVARADAATALERLLVAAPVATIG